MNHQNIDRLFREKLDQMEVQPSSQAWEEVNRQIGDKKSTFYLWIAAAIIPVLIGSYFLLVTKPDSTPIAAIDHPTYSESAMNQIVVKELDFKFSQVTTSAPLAAGTNSTPDPSNSPKVNLMAVANGEASISETEKSIEIPSDTLAVETMVADASTNNAKSPEEDSPMALEEKIIFNPIKITYKAGKTQRELIAEKVEADSISTFKKLIAMADNFSPVEVISDLKTAKDQLLSGGSRNKKDKNSL